jgi:deazaflavin-dependent oxidoreductase (nitroreductase family)
VAKEYKLGFIRRMVNRLVSRQVANDQGDERVHLLTTVGRKTGQQRSTPVTLVEVSGSRWLVAPYGEVGWVHNVRAAGVATLRRGERSEKIAVVEATDEEAAPVLAHYLETVSIVRPYFDVSHGSPLTDIARVAHRHPVFRIS